jgi:uncharacterized protein YjiS (DUF1127 family)
MRLMPKSRLTTMGGNLIESGVQSVLEAGPRRLASGSLGPFRGMGSPLVAVDERKIAQEALMRIALPHFAFERSQARLAPWRGELQSWRRRARERDELARMSDGDLRDIGVTSAERWTEVNKPCWRG